MITLIALVALAAAAPLPPPPPAAPGAAQGSAGPMVPAGGPGGAPGAPAGPGAAAGSGGAMAAPEGGLAAGAPGAGAETVTVQMQFDNRGMKVARPATLEKIARAVADCVCNVPVSQIKYGGTLGQSTLLNHQSVSTFTCTGPTTIRQPLLKTCKRNTRGGLIRSSTAHSCIKKYTDTWAPGNAVDLQKTTCTA